MATVVIISYILAIFRIEIKSIWILLCIAITYLACVVTRKWIKPSTALFAMLAGIIVTHIPWWISHHVTHGISYHFLIDYFFKGTKMFYSILGVVVGYLIYKLVRVIKSKDN